MSQHQPVALITGAAQRIGATISRSLHQAGYRVLIHYRSSGEPARLLAAELNQLRPDSATVLQADLDDMNQLPTLTDQALSTFGQLDLLVNNASSFYPTPVQQSTQQQWDQLVNSNLRAAYFLSAGLADSLRQQQGAIINLVDIHAQRGLKGYPIYSIAKAGLQMMTMSLAKELAPQIRVNGVSPGAILWPEADAALSETEKATLLEKVPLGRTGTAEDIARTVLFLAQSPYISGQIISVDGGRSLFS
ncbi:MAG: pteridine reductase [Marinobacterium sp.]|nr:pteridine reductase [Marinobacterium sp.]